MSRESNLKAVFRDEFEFVFNQRVGGIEIESVG